MTLRFDRLTGDIQLSDPTTETFNLSEIMEILNLRKWAVERALQMYGLPAVVSMTAAPSSETIIAEAEKLVMYCVRGTITTSTYPPTQVLEPTP